MSKMRPYQEEALSAISREFEEKRSALVVMPTGTGKTQVFCEFVKRSLESGEAKSALIFAHRTELIQQAAARFKQMTGISPDIEQAEFRAGQPGLYGSPVVVASIQTLASGRGDTRRGMRFSPDIVVVDEAHRSCAATYRMMLKHFEETNPKCRILGVTATPDRADEQALGELYETVAYAYEIPDAIRDGWLVPIRQRHVVCTSLDLSGVRTRNGDLDEEQLERILESEQAIHQMVAPTVEIVGDRRTIVFCNRVGSATATAEVFNRYREGSAAVVSGETDPDTRRAIFRAFGEGKLQFLCNVGIATEGWDDPALDGKGVQCVAMFRPTKSRALYAQCIGRGTRPLPGTVDGPATADARRAAIKGSPKQGMLVLDYCGNAGRHKLVHAADILGGKSSEEMLAERIAKKAEEGQLEEFDVLDQLDREAAELERERQEERERQRRKHVKGKVQYEAEDIDPFAFAGVTPRRRPSWFKFRPATDGQKRLLNKYKVPGIEGLDIDQARQILDKMTKQATPGQRWKLKSLGLDPTRYSFRTAMEAIDNFTKAVS